MLDAWMDRLRASAQPIAVAVLAGIAGTVGSFALAGDTPGFVAAPISAFLAQTLPGIVLTLAIVLLGSLGQQLNLVTAILLATAAFALAAGAGVAVGRREASPAFGATLAGVLAGGVSIAITGAALPSLAAAASVAVVVVLAEADVGPTDVPSQQDRRRVLKAVAGLLAVGVLGAVARRGGVGDRPGGALDREMQHPGGAVLEDVEVIGDLLAEADAKTLDVVGLEPLVSEAFYEVDIATVNPDLDAEAWTLSFTGAVAEERTLDYESLRAMSAEHQFVTLRCVGESLNGEKMDNALWTGVPIAPLLADLDVESDCECVMLRAADGYYEEFPLAALERGFLAWGMNGRELPRAHGYPVRALIPGHWGEINVKWLTEIEFLDRQVDGFWEERGWHGTGPVNTVAKLHAINQLDGGRVQVGGHAYAGTRGVDAVEVSTDGGGTWTRAQLSEALPGEDVWRMWAHEYDSPDRAHEVVVRAVDGTGAVQPSEEAGAFPNGPSGWVSRRVPG